MNMQTDADVIVRDVAVPLSLIAKPEVFGGVRDNDCRRGDLIIREGIAVGMRPSGSASAAYVVLPKFSEAHVHLDKCHTVHRLGNVGGNLHAAMAEQRKDKARWSVDDLRARALRGLSELAQSGCHLVRTHVDWDTGAQALEPPLAWHVLRELAQEMKGKLDLQIAPLLGAADMADAKVASKVAKQVAETGGALGCFLYDQPMRRKSIENAFGAAEKFGIPLDFHVDEGLEDGLDGLSLIADVAIETGFTGPVLCGHACSLMNLQSDALRRALDKIAKAGIFVATLPTTNLYLQGRGNGTPDRRGVTRVKELAQAGVQVVVGTDNVRDAFCPTGTHDPLASLALGVLAAHLDPPLGAHLPMITTTASRALGVDPIHVDGADVRDLQFFNAGTVPDLMADRLPPAPLEHVLQKVAQ